MANGEKGIQFTLNGGWLGRVTAGMLVALFVTMLASVIQMNQTRFTTVDGKALEDKIDAEIVSRQAHVMIPGHPVMDQRVKGLEDTVEKIDENTEWIRRRLETGK